MNYRYLASKTFDSGIVTRTSTMNGVPVYSNLMSRYGKIDDKEYQVEIVKGLPEKVNLSGSASEAKKFILADSALSAIALSVDGSEVIPLSQQFDFRTGKSFNRYDLNKAIEVQLGEDKGLWDLLNDKSYEKRLEKLARKMFSSKNPLTGDDDIPTDSTFYTKFIPLVSITGVVPPQLGEDSIAYFNPSGTVTVAELLDSLNAIKYGSNSNERRKKSLDSMTTEKDFFNEGYNSCLQGMSSPFFKLYKRAELMKPVTRAELAYITVVCWYDFINKFEHINCGKYSLGVNTDWESPSKYASKFKDGSDYKVFKKVTDDEYKIVSIDLHDYKGGLSMTDFKKAMLDGVKAIPLPMFMSLFELDALDLFYFEDSRLDPLKEVSRGEWTYFITKLAKEFTVKFISKGDNSY